MGESSHRKIPAVEPPKKILLNRKGPRIHLNFKSFKLNHVEKKTTKKQQLQFFGKEQCENDLTLTVVTEHGLTPLYRALSAIGAPGGICMEAHRGNEFVYELEVT